MTCKYICITGGIGSGKSIVCKIIKALGFQVYDCDSRARNLMDKSNIIKSRIYNEISHEAVELKCDGQWGEIKRGVLANIVFGSKSYLDKLNEITHAEVRADIIRWATSHESAVPLFIETAIPFTSGIDKISNLIWSVEAPIEIRICRTMIRDHSSREKILARIQSQCVDMNCLKSSSSIPIYPIYNDGEKAILPQIIHRLKEDVIAGS